METHFGLMDGIGEGEGRNTVVMGRPKNSVTGPNGEWELSKLRAVHHKMITLHVMGWQNGKIAEHLGITAQTVSNTINSDLGKAEILVEMERMRGDRADVVGIFKQAAGDIATEMVGMVLDRDTKEDVRARIGLGIMDRIGVGPIRTNVNVDRTFTKEDLEEVMRNAREGGMVVIDMEDVEDVEFEDLSSEDNGDS